MHANGIHVFHAADGDGVILGVAHDLKFDLLVALDALFDEHLVNRGELEGVDADLDQLGLIVGKAAGRSTTGYPMRPAAALASSMS